MMIVRRGILSVSNDAHLIESLSKILPPEHKIIASKDAAGSGYVEYLVEGSTLPEVTAEGPVRVTLLCHMDRDDAGLMTVHASWAHDPANKWFAFASVAYG